MLYAGLETETGLNAGFPRCGNLRMAQTDARMTNTGFIPPPPGRWASSMNS